jgi:hypothetical protein
MTAFLWYLALSASVSIGTLAGLLSVAPGPAPVPFAWEVATAAGYAAGAVVWLACRLAHRLRRARVERGIKQSWWTPAQLASPRR